MRSLPTPRLLVLGALLMLGGTALATLPASGASSAATVISVTVPSATTLTPGGCQAGAAGITDFGTLLPGAQATTGLDCVVEFGSSNDVASLRLAQLDGNGAAMFRPTRGTSWTSFGTGGTYETTFGGNPELMWGLTFDEDDQSFIGATQHFGWSLVRLDAATGAYDPTFGTAGVASINPGPNTDAIQDIALQDDGKIVAVGRVDSCPVGVVSVTNDCLAVARYLPTGAADPAFGGGDGLTLIELVDGGEDDLGSVAIAPDGSIVVAGRTTLWTGADVFLARFRTDGTLDTTFGTSGYVHWPVQQVYGYLTKVTVGPDGSIYATGRDNPTGSWDMLVVKASAAGVPAAAFSGDGKATFELGGLGYDAGTAIAVDSAGRLVVAGICAASGTNDTGVIVLNATSSSPITSFSGDGIACFDLAAGEETGQSMTLGADDGIYLTSASGQDYVACAPCRPIVARIDPQSGQLDPTFDGDGVLTLGNGTTKERSGRPAFGPDGRLFVPGWRDDGGATESLVWAYDSDQITDYGEAGGSWAAGGTVFGACMESTSNVASQAWANHAGCAIGDVAGRWHGIPDSTTSPATSIARSATTVETARVELRFGMETTTNQAPGRYVAPLEFEVVAPGP